MRTSKYCHCMIPPLPFGERVGVRGSDRHREERSDAAIRCHHVISRLDRGIQSLVMCALIIFFLTRPLSAHAEIYQIGAEKIVSQTITLVPSFATMIQFPNVVLSMDLADPRVVHCERSAVDNNTAICKPKTYEAHSTNMIVTTEHNKFNLTIKINPEKSSRSDVVIFKRAGEKENEKPEIEYPECDKERSKDLIDDMMIGFRIENFRRTVSNDYGRLKTDKIMFVGDQIYFTFSVENEHYMAYEVLRVDVYLENLGGMTGMSVRSEKIVSSEYRISSHSLSNGETAYGVVKFKNSILAENQILSLRIVEKTDRRKDLYFKFDTGV